MAIKLLVVMFREYWHLIWNRSQHMTQLYCSRQAEWRTSSLLSQTQLFYWLTRLYVLAFTFLPPTDVAVVMRSVTSMCLWVSVCLSCLYSTFESLEPELRFWCVDTSSQYLGQIHISNSSGQSQNHRSKTGIYTNVTNCTHSCDWQAVVFVFSMDV